MRGHLTPSRVFGGAVFGTAILGWFWAAEMVGPRDMLAALATLARPVVQAAGR